MDLGRKVAVFRVELSAAGLQGPQGVTGILVAFCLTTTGPTRCSISWWYYGVHALSSLLPESVLWLQIVAGLCLPDLRWHGQPLVIGSSSLLRQAVGCCISSSATPDPSVMNRLNQFPVGKLKAEA